jgi:LDH2 family malate/lactate/ureidoglycolate dehydrogenase
VKSWTFSGASEPTGHGAMFIAINIASFIQPVEFKQRMDHLIREIHGAAKADGVERIYVPGEIEFERREKALKDGIELPADVVGSLQGLAEDLHLKAFGSESRR